MIKLTEGYCIDSDRYNFILYKDGGLDKNNHRIMRNCTYHPTLSAALERYFDLRLQQTICGEDLTILEALGRIKTIQQEIKELNEGIKTMEGAEDDE